MKNGLCFQARWIAFLVLLCPLIARAQFSGAPATEGSGSAFSIPQAQLIQPAALVQLLQAGEKDRPLVLQVGSHVMFAEAHIAGSEYAGPGSRAEGLQALQERVNSLPRNTSIVLYCGCCPWERCPNVAPPFARLRQMGFSRVKVLYLANNFGADWVNKGYPVERGR